MNKVLTAARVRWFDKMSGEGAVRVTINGKEYSLMIYACNISGKKTWYPHTACVSYEKDQIIDVEVKWDSYATFVIGLTPGTLDQDSWDTLKSKGDLAFTCDEDGNTTSGLLV